MIFSHVFTFSSHYSSSCAEGLCINCCIHITYEYYMRLCLVDGGYSCEPHLTKDKSPTPALRSGIKFQTNMLQVIWVHRICVLMAESSQCGFESWLRPRCLCPWARHFIIIASLHPENKWVPCEGRVGRYVWLALYAPKWQQLSCVLPTELRWFQEWFMHLMTRGNNVQHQNLVDTCAI